MPKFRIITGLFKAAVNDGPDEDHSPDMVALNGRVRFDPLNRHGAVAYPRLDPPRFISPEPIEAILLDGMLLKQALVGEQLVAEPVELLVSDDDEAIERWQWQVSFHDVRIGGRDGDPVALPSMRFTLSEDTQPLDLTEVLGESRGGGELVVKGPRGVGITSITAQDGELIFDWSDDRQTVIPVPEAVQGPRGEGVPAGGMSGQLLSHTGASTKWVSLLEVSTPNFIPNGDLDMGSAVGWPSQATYQTNDKPAGLPAAVTFPAGSGSQDLASMGMWSVKPGDEIGFEVWVKADKPDSVIYFEVRGPAGQHALQNWTGDKALGRYPVGEAIAPIVWTRWRASTIVPEGVTAIRLGTLYLNHSMGTVRDAAVSVAGLKLYRVGSLRQRLDSLESRVAALE